jgi:hypothetical protein
MRPSCSVHLILLDLITITLITTVIKVNVKLSLCFLNRAPRHEGVIGGVEVQLYAFFDLCTRWWWADSFTLQPLYSIGQEAKWAPEPFWKRLWSEKFPAHVGNRSLPTELSWLLCVWYLNQNKECNVTWPKQWW